MFRISRWRPAQLLLAWLVYWVVLATFAIGPGVVAAWRATQRPDSPDSAERSTVSLSMGDGLVTGTVKEGATTTWTGSAAFVHIALWVGLPPLILWLLWASARAGERRRAPT